MRFTLRALILSILIAAACVATMEHFVNGGSLNVLDEVAFATLLAELLAIGGCVLLGFALSHNRGRAVRAFIVAIGLVIGLAGAYGCTYIGSAERIRRNEAEVWKIMSAYEEAQKEYLSSPKTHQSIETANSLADLHARLIAAKSKAQIRKETLEALEDGGRPYFGYRFKFFRVPGFSPQYSVGAAPSRRSVTGAKSFMVMNGGLFPFDAIGN